VAGTLFFAVESTDFDADLDSAQLWRSDGTEAGTVLVKEIHARVFYASLDWLVNVNGTLFFTADHGSRGGELWKSVGTEAGSVLIKSIGREDSIDTLLEVG
jgi:ELWxxDGT repeat protein